MDQRQFSRYDRFMYAFGAWIRDGMAVPGLYSTSQWPSGRPQAGFQRFSGKSNGRVLDEWEVARKRILPSLKGQVHSTREMPKSRVVIIQLEPEFDIAHGKICRMDEDTQYFIGVTWIEKKINELDDVCAILQMSGRQIRKRKVKVFENLGIML